ncbi:hypothetical protein AOCH_002582 [Aspergillus ochraceoroseus]|uniref:Uncharacterized protein n=1 Tax=Aspergillus ochraceoroseus TaxID=138278 RepID=A0A0F8UVA7_9EURO|nr:hypothetical protein AOCH_002582 [Aspergillus ochraceoroseus]
MAEKQSRRSSLSGSIETLRSTLTGKYGLRKSPTSSSYFTTSRRISSVDSATATMQVKPVSIPQDKVDEYIHGRKARRAIGKISGPLAAKHRLFSSGHDGDNPEASRETQPLRILRLTSRLKPLPLLPRSQTTVGISQRPIHSRIPTPSEPPKTDLYSHMVYQREGRRSVLSSLGKRCTDILRNVDKSSPRSTESKKRGGEDLDRQHDRSQINDDGHGRLQQKYHHHHHHHHHHAVKSATDVCADKELKFPLHTQSTRYNAQCSNMPVITVKRPSTQYSRKDWSFNAETGNREQVILSRNALQDKRASLPAEGLVVRKVRAESNSQLFLPRYYQTTTRGSLCVTNISNEVSTGTRKMASPKRIRLTRGFENLKTQDNARPKPTTRPSYPKSKPEKRQSPQRAKDRPNLVITSLQKEASEQNEKSNAPTNRSIRSPYSGRIPVLAAHISARPQVERAMPRQYWLGRLVTLTNAFHYEDSFNEPDIASGFEMPSSFTRPFQRADGDRAAYRVKRAFMVLENMCATEEASTSLRDFRTSYIRRFGDRWMN